MDYHYNLNLPEDVSKILENDFWIMENISADILKSITEPVKFAATTWIFVTAGSCQADINLISHSIKAPAFVNVKNTQILLPKFISPDFNASIVVMSRRFMENLYMHINNSPLQKFNSQDSVMNVLPEMMPDVQSFFASLKEILNDKSNPYASQALIYRVLYFLYREGYKCFNPNHDDSMSKQGRMSEQFLALVQENFREHRFLDFYAKRLEITAKHLSRTVKNQTGYTAVEWIERYVILEAKVMLKSSNLNIQQISDELNFPSQSFFGKYFKKLTGLSPKEYRNS
jgi:AraC-like DNA-binding protein